jgi:hypothetical protein
MKLEQLRDNARDTDTARHNNELVNISRRKTVLLIELDRMGICRDDGWVLDELPPNAEGVTISHPDLPRSVRAFLSTDGNDTVYLEVLTLGNVGAVPTTAWEIAQEMGATL